MRQEVSQPQSRFSALTREQMAVCGNNKPDQRERESEDAANSPLQLILLRRLPFHVVTWKMFWLKQKENLQAVWSIWSCNAHVLYTPKTLSLPPCVCMGVCSHCVAVTLCWTVANYKKRLGEFSYSHGYFVYKCIQACVRVFLTELGLLAITEKWAFLLCNYDQIISWSKMCFL